MVKTEHLEKVQAKAEVHAEDRLLDLLLPPARHSVDGMSDQEPGNETRERFRQQLREGKLDNAMSRLR